MLNKAALYFKGMLSPPVSSSLKNRNKKTKQGKIHCERFCFRDLAKPILTTQKYFGGKKEIAVHPQYVLGNGGLYYLPVLHAEKKKEKEIRM